MGIIIKHKKHYLTKLPLWITVVIFIGLSPILMGIMGSWFVELTTGEPCDAGNCFWMVLPWFAIYSIPAAVLGLIFLLVIVLVDSILLKKKNMCHQNTP